MTNTEDEVVSMVDRVLFIRRIVIIFFCLIGMSLIGVAISAKPIGLDFTRGFGLIQITQLLVGISFLALGIFIYIQSLRPADTPTSLQADIGIRLAATGLVFAYVSGFSDALQIGTHLTKCVPPLLVVDCGPYIGTWQIAGILLGTLSIVIGLLLYHTSRGRLQRSSLEFILGEKSAPPK